MTRHPSRAPGDVVERLRQADPVPRAGLDATERGEADALLRRILAEPQPTPRRLRPRAAGRLRPLAATAAAVLLAVVALVASDVADRGDRPTIADLAYAAVNDDEVIHHYVLDTRAVTGALPGELRRELELVNGRLEGWYRSDGSTVRSRRFRRDRDGRLRLFYEFARDEEGAVDYDAERNVLGRYRRGELGARSRPVGPLDDFREAYREGKVIERGTTTFHGRRAYRLLIRRAQRGAFRQLMAFYVDRETHLPLGTRETTRLEIDGRSASVRSESIYKVYERLPDTAANRKLLRIGPHPGARRLNGPAVLAP